MPPKQGGPSRLRRIVVGLVKTLAILSGLMALGLVSGFIAMQFAMEKDRVDVPRVIGLDSVAAGELLKERGLTPRVIAEEFSAKIAKGHVSSQRPPSGTRAKIGGEVRLILSRGTDQLEVPSVAGDSLPQAQRVLAEAGLTLGRVLRIHSDVHAAETVIAQDPPAGSAATRGATITLLQSLGPWEELVSMPDLRGREVVTALNLLKELQVEARLDFQQAASREGHVVSQDPPAGSKVKVGSRVQIVVGE